MGFWTDNGEYYKLATWTTFASSYPLDDECYYALDSANYVMGGPLGPGQIEWPQSIDISWEKTKKKCIFDE